METTSLREYALHMTVCIVSVLLYSSCLVHSSPPLARKGREEGNLILHLTFDCDGFLYV